EILPPPGAEFVTTFTLMAASGYRSRQDSLHFPRRSAWFQQSQPSDRKTLAVVTPALIGLGFFKGNRRHRQRRSPAGPGAIQSIDQVRTRSGSAAQIIATLHTST